ncbi:hypothetical protein W97_03121 [Coniosporium apollinis CBS 100218]|uniref:Uncharacterized protein n=1 Tax=Coniosporium apollinis (strain CBS 100218) TaxID=1168221 RepID=R7YPW6_CONA1|nr:uncharacterized protein W97_03121 [Coniosporium apollinis CBS 100218]EON63893.1 hypothetical protein W97_03121 [Coniosporium apollinis CBS 100218]
MTSPSPTEEEAHDDAEASKAQVRFDVKGKEPMRTSESTPGPSNWTSKESQGKSWSQTDKPHINSIGWGNEASEGYVETEPKESAQSLLDKQRQRFSSDDEALAYTLKESIRGLQGFSIGGDSPSEERPTKEVEHPSFQAWVEDDQRMFSGPSNAPSKESIQPTTSLEQRPETPIEAFDSSVEEEEEEEDVDGDDMKMASTEEGCPGSRAESYDEKQVQQAASEASQRESEKRNVRNGSEDAGRVDSVSMKEKATPPDDDPDELYCSH